MAVTSKKTTVQVAFSEEEFLGKLFDGDVPLGTVVTAVDVKRINSGLVGATTLVTVRLTQPEVDEYKDFDTVWVCTPPPMGTVYRVLEDEWKLVNYEDAGKTVRYIKSIEFDGE